MTNTVAKVHGDDLLWMLSAFAEPPPDHREDRDRRLAHLWRQGLTCREIADRLGMTIQNVCVRRSLLGLPRRQVHRPSRRKAAA